MVGEAVANPAMLVLARESRGWTQIELAQQMKERSGLVTSQALISKAEAGRVEVSGSRLEMFATALGYPVNLLCTDPQVHGVGVGLVHHRKRASLGGPALRRIHAELALSRVQTAGLLSLAQTERSHRFHRIEISDLDTPSDAAMTLRQDWGVPDGPVTDLVDLIEMAGGVVLVRDLGVRELDAVTQWLGDEAPLFLLNALAPADRSRFSLAHELGHVIMHREPGVGSVQERQADEFASEFLLPATSIRNELKKTRIDLHRLAVLKQRWGVSMAALLRRAATLGVISDWTYRNLQIEMSALGFRTTEPGEVAREEPSMVTDIVVRLLDKDGFDVDQVAKAAGLLAGEFEQLYRQEHNVSQS